MLPSKPSPRKEGEGSIEGRVEACSLMARRVLLCLPTETTLRENLKAILFSSGQHVGGLLMGFEVVV